MADDPMDRVLQSLISGTPREVSLCVRSGKVWTVRSQDCGLADGVLISTPPDGRSLFVRVRDIESVSVW